MSNQELSLSPALAQVMKRLVAIQQRIAKAQPQVDLQGIAQCWQKFSEEAKRIGDAGWTIPMWAIPAEVSHILEAATKRQIDDVFLDYYEADSGANYRQLKLYLGRRESLIRWRPLIEQCFTAFECGHYLIVVPAMITVIEGAIAKVGGEDAWRQKDPKQTARKLGGYLDKDSIERIIWLSVDAFVSHLFEQHSFAATRPPLINRHWILHGRDELLWNKADCLRLFQAADTIGVKNAA
ncbi:MAG: hypothetical protein OEZ41_06960 [Nitrospirota bacterium]|nr:hypothetical protein [Nitrospirota bacterium]MDH5699683.1 hypothetical protein [Nitrospirota bacterium]